MPFVPSRRQHARFVCRLELKISQAGSRAPMGATMLNIGIGGAYILSKSVLKLSTATLRVALGAETLSVDARIVRSAGTDPKDPQATYYGIEFARDGSTQGRLRLLVDRVRGGPQAGPPPTMSGYWR